MGHAQERFNLAHSGPDSAKMHARGPPKGHEGNNEDSSPGRKGTCFLLQEELPPVTSASCHAQLPPSQPPPPPILECQVHASHRLWLYICSLQMPLFSLYFPQSQQTTLSCQSYEPHLTGKTATARKSKSHARNTLSQHHSGYISGFHRMP